jgi:aspartate carbamoyltransferase catalytic subunit
MEINNKLLSIQDLSRYDIESLINSANNMRKKSDTKQALPPFILGLLFFQESTRTQIGFQSAAYKLGGQVFVVKETKSQNSMSKSESIEDTFRTTQAYADIICIRDIDDKIFSKTSELSTKPVINCGNGYDEHPTQTLIDLMAIKEFHGSIDNLSIAIVGDLAYMRVAHSLLLGLSKFNNIRISCISPKSLSMPKKYKLIYEKSKNKFLETDQLDLRNFDVVYMTGFAPRTPIKTFSKATRKKYQIDQKILSTLKKKAIILCPLPRIDEISNKIDKTKYAKYFEQSDLGVYMRMAIIKKLLSMR